MKKEKNLGKPEVDYKQKAGTAWSHSYLNQKPWHPLSYPNQRRKWIAEQTHSLREQQAADVAREFAQEQQFFRQTAQMSKKEKEKLEQLQAVSFMYMRPPGYDAEAARAAEIADERKRLGLNASTSGVDDGNGKPGTEEGKSSSGSGREKGKARVKDIFGRTVPTEKEFPVLKDAPRLETGIPVRVKPFAVEIRNVVCSRCGAFGHQIGDRECSMKDKLMPNEEARLKREDPLNVILAQTSSEPLKWELKQQPGKMSPARGGFKPDDPNQQIIPDEDIYDEFGGFLAGGVEEDGGFSIPNVLASLSREQRRELTDVRGDSTYNKKRSKEKKSKYKSRRHSKDERRRKRTKHEADEREDNSDSQTMADSLDDTKRRKSRRRRSHDRPKSKRKREQLSPAGANDKSKRTYRSDDTDQEQNRRRR